MASSKYYAYYIRGRQIAVVQHDYTLGSGQTLSQPGLNSVGARGDVLWKSPTEAVADGIEIEYAYSPRYSIDETDDKNTAIDTYVSLDGLLKIIDQGDDDYSASPESLSDGSYIVLKKAGRWNGLHKVKAAGTGYITLYTKCSDSSTVQQSFEEAPELYYNVDPLNDETDTIDLPEYLAKALVYYVKAKMAEDQGDMERMQYNEVKFRALMNRYENSRIWGSRRIAPGVGAIR